MSTAVLKTASVLAFERKLDPSDAMFFSGSWRRRAIHHEWPPVEVKEKTVRGTISNRLKTKNQDPAKLDASIENANIQTVDVASLPTGEDTLKVGFTLRVLGGAGTPASCNNTEYRKKLLTTVKKYVKDHGFDELAKRYAYNLANGRFLWRNLFRAENVEVHVSHISNGEPLQTWVFDALSLSVRNFNTPDALAPSLTQLSALIAKGLAGDHHVLLQVTAFARIGAGQEVFPSQEMILEKGKKLYTANGIAGMHSQKIGNAIRTIDNWHVEADATGPIPVEPYGSVTTDGRAYRRPADKTDFYSLFDNWVLKDVNPTNEQQHFVMATLIRGGVFGAGKE